MKKKINIQDDPFLNDLFKEQPQEKLSADFSNKVMNKIWVEEKMPIDVEPIINKKTWIIIATMMVALFSFVIFFSEGVEPGSGVFHLDNIFAYLNTLNFLENIKIPSISTPGKVLYATLAFLLLVLGDALHTLKKQKHLSEINFIVL